MALAAPTLDGVTLRRPNAYSQRSEFVGHKVEMPHGQLRKREIGRRPMFDLRWRNLPQTDTGVIVLAARGGSLLFQDPAGRAWWVFVDDGPHAVPVPGTAPQRFDVALSLLGRDVSG